MADKTRLDLYLVEHALAPSREKAKAMIMAGTVFVNGERCDKAGHSVAADAVVAISGNTLRYVSRGGLKLEKAMQVFPISLEGLICMDIGASTGGFSDCMLQNGAKRIYAIDVGYGQLAWQLRNDERIVNLERTNVRHLTTEQVPELVGFASVDVSFISLTLVLPVLKRFLQPGGTAVCLVKPQFEAGRENVGKKGVVRDKKVHYDVLHKIWGFCGEQGFCLKGIAFSPVKGPEGNIEYLFYLENCDEPTSITEQDLLDVVEQSHLELNGGETV